MKTNIRQFALSLFLLAFASCKKETLPPAEPVPDSGHASVVSGTPKVYQLTRLGGDSIAYYDDGRLARVGNRKVRYTIYNYGFNTIKAKTYGGPFMTVREEHKYYTDVATGRVYESEHMFHATGTGRIYQYKYDALGRLSERINKFKPGERFLYEYNADGDLVSVWYWTSTYVLDNRLIMDYRFAKEARVQNRAKINNSYTQLDPYLNIFGKGWKHMPKRYLVLKGGTTKERDHIYTYQLNGDGYPVSCTIDNITDPKNAKPFGTFTYDYKV
ncbi:MAG TPA: hypothetical protein VHK69_21965, partial [Chitinophagaceae bacterium]|nr:hypothetical protein [Chitinophagaceae bacterium]